MALDGLNAVLVAIAFLVPGFILSGVLATTFRRRSSSASDLTLQYLTFSCINHGLWSWLIVLMLQGDWLERFPVVTAFLVFLIVFLSPIMLGLLALWLCRTEGVYQLLSALGFMMHRFIPTAWDYKFQQEMPAWVIVRLTDGSTISGFFGNQSFAGDDPDERDLFIEAVFRLDRDGQWHPEPDTAGVLVRASEIATIEFRTVETTV